MTDILDDANRLADVARTGAIEAELKRLAALKAKTPAISAENCIRCDEPIAIARRLAIPGCQLCIDCKTLSERSRRRP
ncbi:TraR/DksA C4-type zinc finger protein [Undibacterium sp.]|uniref:TraR/DksA C4-type zinc finger protein n=1 Tax=Undibacterium sp. TaxID=1914977 RepID=UPI00272F0868|nr:TraR/DksA C4-type zinc finger protein [Undibacterium sp.]MDP1980491.1 TraR/DksA C4-type zinc finger protein [Undibacterium sp.]